MLDTLTRDETIARLNDRCRLGLDRIARVLITRNCLGEFCAGATGESSPSRAHPSSSGSTATTWS